MKKLIFILFLIFVMSVIAENVPSGGSGPRYFTEEEMIEEANKIADKKIQDIVSKVEKQKDKNFFLIFVIFSSIVMFIFFRRKKHKLPEVYDKSFYMTPPAHSIGKPYKPSDNKSQDIKPEPIKEEMFYKEI